MWNWLYDHKYYLPTLWVITIVLLITPIAVWMFYPFAAWFVFLLCFPGLLSVWAEHLASPEHLNLKLPPHGIQPKGIGAVIVRVRIALFGAITTIILILAFSSLVGYDVFTYASLLIAGSVFLGIPVSIFSTQFTLWMVGTWGFVSEIPLNAISIWIALTKHDAKRDLAFQQLYDVENRFFVIIAGYETPFYFRSNSDWLRGDLPPIDNLPNTAH